MRPTVFEPMDMAHAEALLKEARHILDRLGLVFFLRHGTCRALCGMAPVSHGVMALARELEPQRHTGSLKVLDGEGRPVEGAEVSLAATTILTGERTP